MRVTCNASYYEDNSDSCELWVPGSPLFPLGASIDTGEEPGCPDRSGFIDAISG
jgi:hypothetical protein